jgi:hypothetical protein
MFLSQAGNEQNVEGCKGGGKHKGANDWVYTTVTKKSAGVLWHRWTVNSNQWEIRTFHELHYVTSCCLSYAGMWQKLCSQHSCVQSPSLMMKSWVVLP